jgi:hypothetical protein
LYPANIFYLFLLGSAPTGVFDGDDEDWLMRIALVDSRQNESNKEREIHKKFNWVFTIRTDHIG